MSILFCKLIEQHQQTKHLYKTELCKTRFTHYHIMRSPLIKYKPTIRWKIYENKIQIRSIHCHCRWSWTWEEHSPEQWRLESNWVLLMAKFQHCSGLISCNHNLARMPSDYHTQGRNHQPYNSGFQCCPSKIESMQIYSALLCPGWK